MLVTQRIISALRRLANGEVSRGRLDRAYHSLFDKIVSQKSITKIVIIGANDGRINDPIFDKIMTEPKKTEVLAIEPQKKLIPILSDNFAKHPRFKSHCGAVGNGQEITLYSVSSDCWPDLVVPYAKDWPLHRAPSGITSFEKERVEQWIGRYLPDASRHREALCSDRMIADPLINILHKTAFGETVDILQIDVEGFDDVVIQNSQIDQINPKVIRFEHKHLSDSSREQTFAFLRSLGYELLKSDNDCIATRLGSPVCA